MTGVVATTIQDDIAVIRVNNPPVNALSAQVRIGLQEAFVAVQNNNDVKAIVLACEGRTFIAGADITEFGKPMQDPSLPAVLQTMETVTKPIVAALHGTALGGGLEVALTCHYRIAAHATKVGLPEVLLGLLPGAGGTQRLPRLVGAEAALDMITSGKKVGAKQALQMGLVDRLADNQVIDDAITYAKQLSHAKTALRRVSEMTVNTDVLGDSFFDDYRKTLAKTRRGFSAPQACVDAVELAATKDFEDGLQGERQLFIDCLQSTQSAAQRHLFFAERQAASIKDLPKNTPKRDIKKVAVIGAGTMGTGIALNFSNMGIDVVLLEMKQDALNRGLSIIDDYYDSRIKKGRMSEDMASAARSKVTGALDYAAIADADLVIEAVFENMAIKKEVFAKLDSVCKAGAILASNTSTLDVDEIASATRRPEDVIGLHFFSPAQVMRLLEVVRGEKTADDVLATAMALGKHIGKVAVVSGVCDGFIGNRMLKGYGREAGALLLEGALPAQVDRVLYEFGMAMGPMTMADLAGLDVGYKVRQERRERGDIIPAGDGAIADKLVEMGRLGQKTAKGYYRYDATSRAPIEDEEVTKVIEAASAELGMTRRNIDDEEILQRLIYPLINEAALILEEGIAQRPSDIDVVWIYGYGFPVYRGGPMFYADTVGIAHIVTTMLALAEKHGAHWQPAPLLVSMAEQGKRFADLT